MLVVDPSNIGGNFLDIADMHGVAYQTFYKCLWRTIDAIETVEHFGFPYDDAAKLAELERGFHTRNHQSLAGCVGAIDGIAIEIVKPALRDDAFSRRPFLVANLKSNVCHPR
jgi:hypothetical protein